MRWVCAVVLAAGCHASTTVATVGGLTVHLTLATPAPADDVAIASVTMRLSSLTAVSDRAAHDPRASSSDVTLSMGDASDLPLPTAPPGLYSAVDARLGGSTDVGLDVQAVWHTARVHATIATASFDVECADPVRLDPGKRAQLSLSADPSGWFGGLDLGNATSDADDNGINISADDNRALAVQLVGNVLASFALGCSPQ